MRNKICLRMACLLLLLIPCHVFAQVEASDKKDLYAGLHFFESLQEIEDSAIHFIRSSVRTDTDENTIDGLCMLNGRMASLTVKKLTEESDDRVASMSATFFVDPEDAQAFQLELVDDLIQEWGASYELSFYELIGNGMAQTLEPYSGAVSIEEVLAGKFGSDIWAYYEWEPLGNEDCSLLVIKYKRETWFMVSFQNSDATVFRDVPRETLETIPFREAHWGMSYREVNDLESNKLTSNIPRGYPTVEHIELGNGLVANAHYYFGDEGLYWAGYEYIQSHDDPNEYVKDYYFLKEQLISQYGNPQADIISLDDMQQPPDTILQGEDIASGRAELMCRFKMGDTNIVLSLTDGTGSISLVQNHHDRYYLPYLQSSPGVPGM